MRRPARLILLVSGAAALAFLLRAAHLPAAWMFGPLVVSALFAVREWETVALPQPLYLAAQAVIGAALGAGFLPQTLRALPQHAGIFSFAVLFILAASLLNGWILARCAAIAPATAFLGTMPGGAGAMASLSDSLHADTRLVTAMQYIRLLVILASLAACTPLFSHGAPAHAPAAELAATSVPAAALTWPQAGLLAGLAALGWIAALATPIPAAAFLVPTLLYFLLALNGVHLGTCPRPVLAVAYGMMGLQIGGRFHPSTITVIGRVIVPVIGTTLLLLLASIALAWIVAREMGLPFVSSYLAATPGGLDSVAAVATELHVDTTVILAMHLVRLLCVLVAGPWLVRVGARWMGPRR